MNRRERRAAKARGETPEPGMAFKRQRKTPFVGKPYLAFAFFRRLDVERDSDFALAGKLLVSRRAIADATGRPFDEEDESADNKGWEFVEKIIESLIANWQAGETLERLTGWVPKRPPHADEFEDDEEAMNAWAKDTVSTEVRMDKKGNCPDGYIRVCPFDVFGRAQGGVH